mgnify:CR=1 FL=1
MSKSVHGTKTEKNLLTAFAGESQAFQRYTLFAKAAKKEGYKYLAAIFQDNAEMERKHAQRFFSFLEGHPVEITATYPAGKVGTSIENLKMSIAGETEEAEVAYPKFAEIAKEEGFPAIAACFKNIAVIEAQHAARFQNLLRCLEHEKGLYEFEDPETVWICMECGYMHKGSKALTGCPVCLETNSFMPLDHNWYAPKK